MENTNGFYKLENGELLYGPNFVCGPDFDLNIEFKDTYAYPIDGWYWFNTIEEANIFFNITQ